MARRPHILFTATFHSSFIDEDIRILRKHFVVTTIVAGGWTAPLLFIAHLFRADCTFSWFASVYSSILVFLTKLFNKKSILVLGGGDVAKEKSLSYGIWNNPWKSILVRYGLTHASGVLAVDDFLKDEAMRLAGYDGANITTVPTGYDPEFWKSSGKKEPLVLMVASCPDLSRLKLKGVDVFLRVARLLPETKFKMIGVAPHVAASLTIPFNVECLPFLPRETVLQWYQRAKVYCQLSYREGLPNSLCEAMLCECVPVGSNVGGIPSAIGNTGFLVQYNNDEQIARAIREAMAASPESGKSARERIVTHFSQLGREDALKKTIAGLLP